MTPVSDSGFQLHVPPELRRGALKGDERKSIESGLELIELMCQSFGVLDLGSARLLDMGCGVKFTQAFLSRQLPIGEYVGIDVFCEMIDFLNEHVSDPRFSFYKVNTRNAMYNPEGEELSASSSLPVEKNYFDYVCLFSVVTHLAPTSFSALLRQLRDYIKPSGKMLFSLFLNEPSAGGLGFIDKVAKQLAGRGMELGPPKEPEDFIDFFPDDPLKAAIYSRRYVMGLFEGSGWEIESINEPPRESIAHYIVCRPV
jgi:SAM-dependent methyltransferase